MDSLHISSLSLSYTTHTHMHTQTGTSTHKCTHTGTHRCINKHTFTRTHVHAHTHMHTGAVYKATRACSHTHTHAFARRRTAFPTEKTLPAPNTTPCHSVVLYFPRGRLCAVWLCLCTTLPQPHSRCSHTLLGKGTPLLAWGLWF